MPHHEVSGKRVLVTGGLGFIGSALARELLRKGSSVIIYDNFLYGTKSNISEIENSLEIVNGDILSWKIYEAMIQHKVDYVFHLAAEPYIPKSYDNPEKFFDVNVKGTMNVLAASKVAGVKRVVYFSSSEVYGTAKYTPMDENHPTLPLSTYAVSKLASDRLCFVFNHEHGVPVLVVRPFNCYGPRETQPYVIPEIISQLSRGRVVELGNVKAKRDFTYVEDTARGAIALMESDIPDGEVVNLGSGKTYSIEEIALLVGRVMNRNDMVIRTSSSRMRPLDVDLLQCDCSKAKKYTGWEPAVDIREGLERTVKWYVDNGGRWSWEGVVNQV